MRTTAFLSAADPLRLGTLPTGVPVEPFCGGGWVFGGWVFELDDGPDSDGRGGFEPDGGRVVEVEGPVVALGGGVRAVDDVVALSSPPQPARAIATKPIGRSLLTAGARGATSSRAGRR